MKLFACGNCQQSVFFESVQCVQCGQTLAYLPDRTLVCAVNVISSELGGAAAGTAFSPPAAGPSPAPVALPRWRVVGDGAEAPIYRPCRNQVEFGVCNWGVRDDDPNEFCLGCRLNHIIPNMGSPEARLAWQELENAKRRVLYTLQLLEIPVEGKAERADGLEFNFKQDNVSADEPHVVTGHADGVITINAAEADDGFREETRVRLGERYRTVLGHVRHEIGHHYWERLIKGSERLGPFRKLFGNEELDYAEAQKAHYGSGAPPDWPARFVSAYASMHPWEDWAETWAHYLHLVDTLETARAYGLHLRPRVESKDGEKLDARAVVAASRLDFSDFRGLIESWVPLTVALNNFNRSMGTRDSYPFVLSQPAISKLEFVHDVIIGARMSESVAGHRGADSNVKDDAKRAPRPSSPAVAMGQYMAS